MVGEAARLLTANLFKKKNLVHNPPTWSLSNPMLVISVTIVSYAAPVTGENKNIHTRLNEKILIA